MPGVIDPHVHFGFGSPETDFLTESRSAALGGVTSALSFYRTADFRDAFDAYRDRAASQSCIDFGLHFGITSHLHVETLAECSRRFGVTSYKLYLMYKGAAGLAQGFTEIDDALLYAACKATAAIEGAVLGIHCENVEVIPSLARAVAPRRSRRPPRVERAKSRFPRGRERASCLLLRGQDGCRDQHRAPVEPRGARRSAPPPPAHQGADLRGDVPALPLPRRRDACRRARESQSADPRPRRRRCDVGRHRGRLHRHRRDRSRAAQAQHQSGQGHLGIEQRVSRRCDDAADHGDEGHHRRGIAPSASRPCCRATPHASTAWRTRARSPSDTTRTSRSSTRTFRARSIPAALESFADYSPYENMSLKGWPVATLSAAAGSW